MTLVYRSVKGSALTIAEADGNIEYLDDNKVNNTGNETIAGVKTFSSIPLLPASDPTTDNQAGRKAYIDARDVITLATANTYTDTEIAANAYDDSLVEYLDGSRARTGDLDMGSNAIVAASTYNGYVPEDAANKSTDVDADKASNIKYSTPKSVYDWAVSVFQTLANKDASGGYAGLTLFKINFKNVANTFTSFFTNTNTASRTYTFQDRDGTIADNTDLDLKLDKINSASSLTDGSAITLTGAKHTLTSVEATITYAISYTGDDITIEVTLLATGSVYTFPSGSLCVSEGLASGDNTCTLAGDSGDKYIISIKKIESIYYVACKNFAQ